MCGRFLLDADYEALIERYRIFEDIQEIYERKIEIFPSENIWTLSPETGKMKLRTMPWGMKINIEGKLKTLINSRSETMNEKRMFQNMLPCIIPSTGYYEWHEKTKDKYIIHARGLLFSYAGLFSPQTHEVVIVTKAANLELSPIHSRMPVLLSEEDEGMWLKKRVLNGTSRIETLLTYDNLESVQQLTFL